MVHVQYMLLHKYECVIWPTPLQKIQGIELAMDYKETKKMRCILLSQIKWTAIHLYNEIIKIRLSLRRTKELTVLESQTLTMFLSAVISLGSVELSVWCHLIFNIGLPNMQ
jgi:hypothetical protein